MDPRGELLRVAVGIVAPLVLGSLLVFQSLFAVVLPFVILAVGVQSVLYSFIMEFCVNRYVHNVWLATFISAVLAALSVAVLGLDDLVVVGGTVGTVTGLILAALKPPAVSSKVSRSCDEDR